MVILPFLHDRISFYIGVVLSPLIPPNPLEVKTKEQVKKEPEEDGEEDGEEETAGEEGEKETLSAGHSQPSDGAIHSGARSEADESDVASLNSKVFNVSFFIKVYILR